MTDTLNGDEPEAETSTMTQFGIRYPNGYIAWESGDGRAAVLSQLILDPNGQVTPEGVQEANIAMREAMIETLDGLNVPANVSSVMIPPRVVFRVEVTAISHTVILDLAESIAAAMAEADAVRNIRGEDA